MSPVRRPLVRPQAAPIGPGVDLADWALGALAGLLAVAGVLWLGAALAALVTGHGVPDGGLADALAVVGRFGDPGSAWPHPSHLPGPVAYWTATTAVFAAVVGVVFASSRLHRRLVPGPLTHDRIRSLPGLANAAEAEAAAGRRALLRRARDRVPAAPRRSPRVPA